MPAARRREHIAKVPTLHVAWNLDELERSAFVIVFVIIVVVANNVFVVVGIVAVANSDALDES